MKILLSTSPTPAVLEFLRQRIGPFEVVHVGESDWKEKVKNEPIFLTLGQTATKLLGFEESVFNLRGSVLTTIFGNKTLFSLEPAYIFKDWSSLPYFKYDILKLKRILNSETSAEPPFRNIRILYEAEDVCTHLLDLLNQPFLRVAIDIEGYPDSAGISCISFALSPTDCFVIPFRKKNGSSCFSFQDECKIWKLLSKVLFAPHIEKILQNGLYDTFVLLWSHKIRVNNFVDDTMMLQWELYPELEKSLSVLTSLYTNEPYYKNERNSKEDKVHFLYNGKDSAVTMECCEVMTNMLKSKPGYEHYKFNISLLEPYLYMSYRGCKIDTNLLRNRRSLLAGRLCLLQTELNQILKFPFNCKSSVQKAKLFYDLWKLPKKFRGRGQNKKLTTDEQAIVELFRNYGNDFPLLRFIQYLVTNRTFLSDGYKLEPFSDGRIRSSFNPVGTDTGRLSSSETAVTGKTLIGNWKFKSNLSVVFEEEERLSKLGTNLQNVTENWRDVFIPDTPEHEFWNVDLSGADAWTVACDLAYLGYPNMLEDLKFGIKPSLVILMMKDLGTKFSSLSRQEIKDFQNDYKKDAAMYLCAKRIQHGTNYKMHAEKIVELLLKDSNVIIPEKTALQLQNLYELRYQISKRHDYIKQRLINDGYILTSCGTKRIFFNKRTTIPDEETLRSALAFEPQYITTYCTNKALAALYYGEKNRKPNGGFYAEPLLMVHDALAGQSLIADRSKVSQILIEAFNNPIKIKNITITIPFDGGFGPNWKEYKTYDIRKK